MAAKSAFASMRVIFAACAALALAACATTSAATNAEPRWQAAWATAQQIAEPHNALEPADLTDKTLRQLVRVSVGGSQLRVRLSNAFGTEPLALTAVHVARAEQVGTPRIAPGSDVALTFSGQSSIIIPTGADYVSDPVDMDVSAFDDVAITLHIAAPLSPQTSHPGSRTNSFVAAGNQVSATDLPGAKAVAHWYFIAGIEVMGRADGAAIAIIGDSITDGRGSTTDGNDRWTDFLARRLQADPATTHLGVLNFGLGGNRMLNDGLGPNASSRIDRDVLGQTNARYLILYEGVNDLGTFARDNPNATRVEFEAHARRIIAAYDQIVTRAHANDVKVIGVTIPPYGGGTVYQVNEASEAARLMINTWIRTSGLYDGIADFDAILRNPAAPTELLPHYDTGDRLHPNVAAFQVMADAIPLDVFGR